MKSHQKKAASFLITAFAALVLAISATTSFGFFFNFFDALVPPDLFGSTVGAIISGIVGVLLFDVACAIWLYTFLHNAETAEQRAITLIMTTLTFVGAAAASVAHLALSASHGAFLADLAAQDNIGLIALITVILGVIADFGATLAYQRFSQDNKDAVREADRRDRILQAEDEQARELDDLVTQKVKNRLTSVADSIAEQQAARLAAAFQRREGAKYGSPDTHADSATADRVNGYSVEIEDPAGQWQWTAVTDKPMTLDQAKAEMQRHPEYRRRIVNYNGRVVQEAAKRPATATNGHHAGSPRRPENFS